MRHLLPAAVLLVVTAAQAQQPIVTTLISSGSTSSRYDMVILGDGYRATEQARFNQDVTTFLTSLFSRQPYATWSFYFNVHTVFRASIDSGASHPDAVPAIVRNTSYGASYNTGGTARCLYINNTTQALQDAALAPANEGRVLVMVNDSRYGGCAAQFAVSYNGASMVDVQTHELGHSLGSLADEYDYPNGTFAGSEPGQANLTANPAGQKWSSWWGVDGIASFEGAGYYRFGLWRPRSDCLMRNLGQPLCAVCREQISRTTNAVVDTIHNETPATTSLTLSPLAQQAFSFDTIVPAANNPVITWSLDNQTIPGQTGLAYVLDVSALTLGQHTLRVTVQDQSPLVRQDPSGTMRDSHTWTLNIADPLACDLQLPAMFANQVLAQPGSTIDITTSVRNDGPNSAVNFVLEHFLSLDAIAQTTDFYLGAVTIPLLNAGQQVQVVRQVQLPQSMQPLQYYLFGIADRTNTILETSEFNNRRNTIVIGQPGSCAPALEYGDDLLYPRNSAAVSTAIGGTIRPTVVARCAPPGSLYLIAWGFSGTGPGTTLAPGVTVPLNGDLMTTLGLESVNGPVFQQFLGTLDAAGIGRATFAWPAGLPMQPASGHFAAVVIDPTPAFYSTTNAIVVHMQP